MKSSVDILKGHKDVVNCLVELKNTEVISGSDDHTIKVWNIQKRMCVSTLKGHDSYVNCLIELFNGNVLSASSDKTMRVWKR